jgi:hypothetical protein
MKLAVTIQGLILAENLVFLSDFFSRDSRSSEKNLAQTNPQNQLQFTVCTVGCNDSEQLAKQCKLKKI